MGNYPGRFGHGITIRGVPLTVSHPGETFWVDENASFTGRGTFKNPDVSIESCMARCVADRGDIIMVKPGHVENISAAADLTCDVAGVAIVGSGRGAAQSQIVFDTADTATVSIGAANVSFVNMWFLANYADVATAISVVDAGDYFTIEGCRITNTSTILNFLVFCYLADDADYFGFYNNDVHLIEGSAANSLVHTVGESLTMRVIGNNIIAEAAESIFDIDAAQLTGAPLFRDNTMVNLTALADFCVEVDATTVGVFAGERYACASTTSPVAVVTASFFVDAQASELANVSSLAFPATAIGWP